MTIISPRAGVTSHSEGEIVTGTVALPLGATVATCPVLMALLKALKAAVVLMVSEREPLVAEVEALGEVAEARTCRVQPEVGCEHRQLDRRAVRPRRGEEADPGPAGCQIEDTPGHLAAERACLKPAEVEPEDLRARFAPGPPKLACV